MTSSRTRTLMTSGKKLPVSLRTKWIDSTNGWRTAHTPGTLFRELLTPQGTKQKENPLIQNQGHVQQMQRPWWLHVRFISRGAIE